MNSQWTIGPVASCDELQDSHTTDGFHKSAVPDFHKPLQNLGWEANRLGSQLAGKPNGWEAKGLGILWFEIESLFFFGWEATWLPTASPLPLRP